MMMGKMICADCEENLRSGHYGVEYIGQNRILVFRRFCGTPYRPPEPLFRDYEDEDY